MIKAFLRVFDRVCDMTAIFILNVTVVVVFVQVVSRYVFKAPIAWTEEVARFMFIWLVFAGIAITERQKAHFRITFFVERLSPRIQFGLWLFGELLIFGALLWLLVESVGFVRMGARQVSAVMELRLHYIYAAVPAAVVLALLNRFRNFGVTLTENRERPFH